MFESIDLRTQSNFRYKVQTITIYILSVHALIIRALYAALEAEKKSFSIHHLTITFSTPLEASTVTIDSASFHFFVAFSSTRFTFQLSALVVLLQMEKQVGQLCFTYGE